VDKIPYFELKVVKVKKEKKYCNYMIIDGEKYTLSGEYLHKEKGNWVNGENLDKIKFPCFCSYVHAVTKKKHYAKIDKGWDGMAYKEKYIISKISNEITNCIMATTDPIPELSILYELYEDISLKKLIKNLDIHILKGKIIIYDDDMEDKYSDD